jgi:TonB family protein
MSSSEKLETLGRYGRYEVQAEIGGGAMGRVYRGYDPLARRHVAIKTIKSELLSNAAAEEYVRRFRREAQAAGGLSHPNIVTIYDVGENFLVMELLEGETLQVLLARRGRIDLHEAIEILAPVADALDHAHRKGIVHRDIKPANIMILPTRGPKLMDFGVVHLESTVMTAAGECLGSPLYMAPEQIAAGEVSARTDVFALAAVAYEMLTGRRAFEGQSITSIIHRVMHDAPAPPRRFNLELPPHYDDVFARALAKDPAARFASTKELIAALDVKDFDETMGRAFASSDVGTETVDVSMTQRGLGTMPLGSETLPPVPLPVPAASASVRTRLPAPIPAPAPGRAPRTVRAAVLLALVGLAAAAWLARPRVAPAVDAPPSPVAPPLRIESEPPGAQAFLDDREVGRTPLTVPGVPAGSHVVRVAHDGYAPAQLSVTVSTTLPPLRFVLEPAVAPLNVVSQPAGADVFLDDRRVGETPIAALPVPPGSHDLRVERAGYRPWRTTVNAEIGKVIAIEAPLVRVPAARREPTAAPTPIVREGDLVELTPEVVPPRRISGKLASYPSAAAKKKLQGRVTIGLLVDEKGEPQDLVVVSSAGDVLDRAVLDAVRQWRYEPAQKNGVKVRVRIEESQGFELRSR